MKIRLLIMEHQQKNKKQESEITTVGNAFHFNFKNASTASDTSRWEKVDAPCSLNENAPQIT